MQLWYAFCDLLPFEMLQWKFMCNALLAVLLSNIVAPFSRGHLTTRAQVIIIIIAQPRAFGKPLREICYI